MPRKTKHIVGQGPAFALKQATALAIFEQELNGLVALAKPIERKSGPHRKIVKAKRKKLSKAEAYLNGVCTADYDLRGLLKAYGTHGVLEMIHKINNPDDEAA